mmetsp:Transcript_1001/g.2417  ORF Transcript_1001/g.2417 Transcript_1001/m.2417 type:complete len:267 (+) Transcript_1001:510-1310(+)
MKHSGNLCLTHALEDVGLLRLLRSEVYRHVTVSVRGHCEPLDITDCASDNRLEGKRLENVKVATGHHQNMRDLAALGVNEHHVLGKTNSALNLRGNSVVVLGINVVAKEVEHITSAAALLVVEELYTLLAKTQEVQAGLEGTVSLLNNTSDHVKTLLTSHFQLKDITRLTNENLGFTLLKLRNSKRVENRASISLRVSGSKRPGCIASHAVVAKKEVVVRAVRKTCTANANVLHETEVANLKLHKIAVKDVTPSLVRLDGTDIMRL